MQRSFAQDCIHSERRFHHPKIVDIIPNTVMVTAVNGAGLLFLPPSSSCMFSHICTTYFSPTLQILTNTINDEDGSNVDDTNQPGKFTICKFLSCWLILTMGFEKYVFMTEKEAINFFMWNKKNYRGEIKTHKFI